jgi:hypothetical protein
MHQKKSSYARNGWDYGCKLNDLTSDEPFDRVGHFELPAQGLLYGIKLRITDDNLASNAIYLLRNNTLCV